MHRTRRIFFVAICLLAAASSPAAADEFAEPVGELTLRDAVVAALRASPELAASSWMIRAKEAEGLQAGVLPNPELGVSVEDVGNFGKRSSLASENETSVMLSELVELGGKR